MEAQLKGAVLIALVVVPLSAKLPPRSETAPHSEWQNGKILGPGTTGNGSTLFEVVHDVFETQRQVQRISS